jgi:hypothetical protein
MTKMTQLQFTPDQVTPQLKIVLLDGLHYFMYRKWLVKMKADTVNNRIKAVVLIVCQIEHQQSGDWVGYVRRNADQLLKEIGTPITDANRDTLMDYAKGFNPDDESNFQPI